MLNVTILILIALLSIPGVIQPPADPPGANAADQT